MPFIRLNEDNISLIRESLKETQKQNAEAGFPLINLCIDETECKNLDTFQQKLEKAIFNTDYRIKLAQAHINLYNTILANKVDDESVLLKEAQEEELRTAKTILSSLRVLEEKDKKISILINLLSKKSNMSKDYDSFSPEEEYEGLSDPHL